MYKLYSGEEYKRKNSITAQMLGVLVFLVEYGAYQWNATELPLILHKLVKILDGSSDEYTPGNLTLHLISLSNKIGKTFNDNNKYKINFSGNKIVFKIKAMFVIIIKMITTIYRALQCLKLLLKRHFYTSLQVLLYVHNYTWSLIYN